MKLSMSTFAQNTLKQVSLNWLFLVPSVSCCNKEDIVTVHYNVHQNVCAYVLQANLSTYVDIQIMYHTWNWRKVAKAMKIQQG